MAVKTITSWSAHARTTRPGNRSGSMRSGSMQIGVSLGFLGYDDLFKGLTHIVYGESDHTVILNS